MTPKRFVKAYLLPAFKSKITTGVPVLVTLAQCALESGWGKHAPGNNFFGVKAGSSWDGEIQELDTTEYENGKKIKVKAKFRKYETPEQSFTDHGNLLKKRWANSFVHTDPVDFVNSMQNDYPYKYATDPEYSDKISDIIRMLRTEIMKAENIYI